MNREDLMILSNQVSFPLYAGAKEVVRLYKPLLAKYNLTYTQFLVMLVLWEKRQQNVKSLGEHLYLDSGTLTPLLRKLEKKGYLNRERSRDDERNVILTITPEGDALKDKVAHIPNEILEGVTMDKGELDQLYTLLNKLLAKLSEQ